MACCAAREPVARPFSCGGVETEGNCSEKRSEASATRGERMLRLRAQHDTFPLSVARPPMKVGRPSTKAYRDAAFPVSSAPRGHFTVKKSQCHPELTRRCAAHIRDDDDVVEGAATARPPPEGRGRLASPPCGRGRAACGTGEGASPPSSGGGSVPRQTTLLSSGVTLSGSEGSVTPALRWGQRPSRPSTWRSTRRVVCCGAAGQARSTAGTPPHPCRKRPGLSRGGARRDGPSPCRGRAEPSLPPRLYLHRLSSWIWGGAPPG